MDRYLKVSFQNVLAKMCDKYMNVQTNETFHSLEKGVNDENFIKFVQIFIILYLFEPLLLLSVDRSKKNLQKSDSKLL